MITQYKNHAVGATAIEIRVPSNKEFVVSKSTNCLLEFESVGSWEELTNDTDPHNFVFRSPPSGLLKISRTDANNAKIEIYG